MINSYLSNWAQIQTLAFGRSLDFIQKFCRGAVRYIRMQMSMNVALHIFQKIFLAAFKLNSQKMSEWTADRFPEPHV